MEHPPVVQEQLNYKGNLDTLNSLKKSANLAGWNAPRPWSVGWRIEFDPKNVKDVSEQNVNHVMELDTPSAVQASAARRSLRTENRELRTYFIDNRCREQRRHTRSES